MQKKEKLDFVSLSLLAKVFREDETGRRGFLNESSSKGEPYENLAGNRVLNLIKTGSSPLRWLIEQGEERDGRRMDNSRPV